MARCPICELPALDTSGDPIFAYTLGAVVAHNIGYERSKEIMCRGHRTLFVVTMAKVAASIAAITAIEEATS